MSPAEYLEIIRSDIIAVHTMNAIYILFAYIVAIFLAGRSLDRFQVTGITVLYSLFFMIPASASLSSWNQLLALSRMFAEEHPEIAQDVLQPGLFPISPQLQLAIYVLAWLLSIVFMIRIRTDTKNGSDDT